MQQISGKSTIARFWQDTRLRWAGLGILLIGAGVFGLFAPGASELFAKSAEKNENRQSSAEAIPVESLRLSSLSSLETRALYSGTVEAARGAQLAFERSGRVSRVLVNEGQAVALGQVLAQLDTSELAVQLQQAKSQLAQAEALSRELHAGPRVEAIASIRAQLREAQEQLRLARTQESRREELLRREAISREEMDSFRTQVGALEARSEAVRERLRELEAGTRSEQLDGQKAQVALAAARVEEIRIQLAKSSLRAPFAGKISKRFVDEGAYASPGTPMLEVIEANRPEIRVGLPADLAAGLTKDGRYPVLLGGKRYESAVLRVLPELDSTTRVVSVLFEVPSEAQTIALPGTLAQVEMPRTLDEKGFRMPVGALTRADRGLWACYALVGDGDTAKRFHLERREVEILHAEGEFVYVRGLVKAGERIVANGVNRVTEGQQVQVVKEL